MEIEIGRHYLDENEESFEVLFVNKAIIVMLHEFHGYFLMPANSEYFIKCQKALINHLAN